MRLASRAFHHRLVILGLSCALGLALGGSAFAQEIDKTPAPIYTDIQIPLSPVDTSDNAEKLAYFSSGKVVDLAQYLGFIYNFLISIVGLVASVMMVVGGFQYLTSAGDSGRIGAAKSRIANAFIGMLLALGAYTILNTINPALVVLKVPRPDVVSAELSFLPWCGDVTRQGLADPSTNGPQPVAGEASECGSIGVYVPKDAVDVGACADGSTCANGRCGDKKTVCGKPLSFCLYRGNPTSCPFFIGAGDLKRRSTCMPKLLTGAEIEQMHTQSITTGDDTAFRALRGAECLGCGDLGEAKAIEMGFAGNGPGVCATWSKVANGGPFDSKTHRRVYTSVFQGQGSTLAYCGFSTSQRSCVQSDMDCDDVATNDENEFIGAFFDADNADCDGYNEGSNNIIWHTPGNPGSLEHDSDAQLEDYPDHLYNVCAANPCGFHASVGGCDATKGLLTTITHFLTSGKVSGIKNCSNP